MTSGTPRPGRPGGVGAALAVRVGPADLGRRVTVRWRTEDGRPSDTVGLLRSWTDGVLVLQRRDGGAVEVPADAVLAARAVAPEIAAETLQQVVQHGWPPWEHASLGDWELRAAGGITGRVNSVRVTGDPGTSLDAALATVRDWYGTRDLTPLLQVPSPSRWDDDLEARGWVGTRGAVVRTGTPRGVLDAASPALDPAAGLVVTHADDPDPAFVAFVEPGLPADGLRRILTAPAVRTFVTVHDEDGGLLAAGRASATGSPVGRWVGITSVMVAERARRRGLATFVVAELARWGLDRGCDRLYLQSLATNAAAAALYDRLGIPVHHAYRYLAPADHGAGAD